MNCVFMFGAGAWCRKVWAVFGRPYSNSLI